MPPAEGAVSYPLALKTPWGTTTLERRPTRIAAMGVSGGDAELLAALGVMPVAAPDTVERSVWTLDALPGTIEHIIASNPDAGAPVEKIAAAAPDLIVVAGDDLSKDYAKLAAIAPVLGVERTADIDASWRDRILAVGRALDLEGAARKVTADHDTRLAAIRSAHPQLAGKTATYAILYGGDYGLAYRSVPGSDTEKLLQGLGLRPNPSAQSFVKDDTVSTEQLGRLDADVLLLADNSEQDDDRAITALTNNPLWKKIPAVAEERWVSFKNTGEDYVFDGKKESGNLAWAMSMSGPLADTWAAERLAPMVMKALPTR